MIKIQSKVIATSAPWWLSGGEEVCPHCDQLYFIETEVRCTECDGAMCPHCKVRHAEGYLVCPECVERQGRG